MPSNSRRFIAILMAHTADGVPEARHCKSGLGWGHVFASIIARNSGVTSGMIPNQAWNAGRAWCSSMPSPLTVGLPRLRAAASSGVSRGM